MKCSAFYKFSYEEEGMQFFHVYFWQLIPSVSEFSFVAPETRCSSGFQHFFGFEIYSTFRQDPSSKQTWQLPKLIYSTGAFATSPSQGVSLNHKSCCARKWQGNIGGSSLSIKSGRGKSYRKDTCAIWSSAYSYPWLKPHMPTLAKARIHSLHCPLHGNVCSSLEREPWSKRKHLPSLFCWGTPFSMRIYVGHDVVKNGVSLSDSESYSALLPSQGPFDAVRGESSCLVWCTPDWAIISSSLVDSRKLSRH